METRLSLAMQFLKVKNEGKAGPAGEDTFVSDKGQLGKQQVEIPTAAYKAKTCFVSKNAPAELQKRAMRIIFPFILYSDALHQANLETLSRRRQSITTKLFDSITCTSDHKLHELLLPRNNCESNLRRKRNFNIPLAKTKRLKNTFIYRNSN